MKYISLDKIKTYLAAFQKWVSPTLYNISRNLMNTGSKYQFIGHYLNNNVSNIGISINDYNSFDSVFYESKIMCCVALPMVLTSTATSTKNMFYGCTLLKWCDLTYLPISNIINTEGMFYGCTMLTDLVLPGLATDLDLSDCPLTEESATVLISQLSSTSPATLTLSNTTYKNLTKDELQVGLDNGWNIIEG